MALSIETIQSLFEADDAQLSSIGRDLIAEVSAPPAPIIQVVSAMIDARKNGADNEVMNDLHGAYLDCAELTTHGKINYISMVHDLLKVRAPQHAARKEELLSNGPILTTRLRDESFAMLTSAVSQADGVTSRTLNNLIRRIRLNGDRTVSGFLSAGYDVLLKKGNPPEPAVLEVMLDVIFTQGDLVNDQPVRGLGWEVDLLMCMGMGLPANFSFSEIKARQLRAQKASVVEDAINAVKMQMILAQYLGSAFLDLNHPYHEQAAERILKLANRIAPVHNIENAARLVAFTLEINDTYRGGPGYVGNILANLRTAHSFDNTAGEPLTLADLTEKLLELGQVPRRSADGVIISNYDSVYPRLVPANYRRLESEAYPIGSNHLIELAELVYEILVDVNVKNVSSPDDLGPTAIDLLNKQFRYDGKVRIAKVLSAISQDGDTLTLRVYFNDPDFKRETDGKEFYLPEDPLEPGIVLDMDHTRALTYQVHLTNQMLGSNIFGGHSVPYEGFGATYNFMVDLTRSILLARLGDLEEVDTELPNTTLPQTDSLAISSIIYPPKKTGLWQDLTPELFTKFKSRIARLEGSIQMIRNGDLNTLQNDALVRISLRGNVGNGTSMYRARIGKQHRAVFTFDPVTKQLSLLEILTKSQFMQKYDKLR